MGVRDERKAAINRLSGPSQGLQVRLGLACRPVTDSGL